MKSITYRGEAKRLTRVIADFCPLLSYNQIQRLLKNKDIKLDGVRINADCVVENGAKIDVYVDTPKLKTIYEDDNILVVYKPKGLPSEGDVSAESVMKEHIKGLFLCHRLDTNTDGLLMFAKSEKVFDELTRAFKHDEVEKHYTARVYGKFKTDTVYKDYLEKCENGRVKIYPSPKRGAVEVVTDCRVSGYDGNTTILDVVIHNGKMHQIRAQLAAHGYFILGDSKYGRDEINRKLGYKKQQLTATGIVFLLEKSSFLAYLNGKNVQM